MKLEYHKEKNFGDALNPIVFHYFLPDFFDEDSSSIFLGIGSILGLKIPKPNQKIIVFSSGYASGADTTYGPPPQITKNYKIVCVRGPLTAKLLNINPQKAITDGAILLAAMHWQDISKKYEISYIPHVGSLDFFDWENFCHEVGLHFINPKNDPLQVISEIRASKKIISEAMHGAIVDDSFRIPWLSVKAYSTINRFKWKDWCDSMNLNYNPVILSPLFSKDVSFQIIKNKLPTNAPRFIINLITYNYLFFQEIFLKYKNRKTLLKIKKIEFNLSKDIIFKSKLNQMLEKIEYIKKNL